jgi:hypothetical protein
MSFRDSAEREASPASSLRELHPIQDLIDTVRSNRERRIQERAERRAAHSEHHEPEAHHKSNSIQFAGYKPSHQQNDSRSSAPRGDSRSSLPLPVVRAGYNGGGGDELQFADNRGVRKGTEAPPVVHRLISAPAPEAPPQQGGTAGQDGNRGEPEQELEFPKFSEYKFEKSDEGFPEPMAVTERNGAVVQIPEAKNASADDRLAGYLKARGAQADSLDLNGTKITNVGLAQLGRAPFLQKLWLNDCDIDNDSMKVIGQQGLRHLKDVNLHSTRVGDEGVAQLAKMPLLSLNLSDTAVSDDCMQHVKAMQNLQVLNLDYSGVGNDGIRAIQQMPNLRSLSLKGCPITDDCVKELAKCQQLMVLHLDDTKLSPAQVQWLHDKMPKCVISAPDNNGEANQGQQQRRIDRHDKVEPRKGRFFQNLIQNGPPPRR